MSIADVPNFKVNNGNGVATVFSFSFKTQLAEDIKAFLITATDAETTLVKDTDYTVSLNADGTGSVTYPISGVPLPTGDRLLVKRISALDQLLNLKSQSTYSPESNETQYDKLTMIHQQADDRINRAIVFPQIETNIVVLPIPSIRANKAVGFDGSGNLAMLDPTGLLANYVPPFSGGVNRTFTAKVSDIVSAKDFGVTGDGVTDESAQTQVFFDYLDSLGTTTPRVAVFPLGSYKYLSKVTIPDPHNLFVDARGARFITPNDIIMFDCNGRADPLYIDNTSRQHFWWDGGFFECTAASPTVATSLLMRGFRNAGVSRASFEGFYAGINFSGKDSIYFEKLKFFNNTRPIWNQAWSTIGGPLNVFFKECHLSMASATEGILLEETVSDCSILNGSFNMGDGATSTAIKALRQIYLIVDTVVGGPFTIGETITAPSGGSMVIESITQSATGIQTLAGSANTGTFVTSETITGGTSLATANTRAVDNNPEWVNFNIKRNHFEAGTIAAGAICVDMIDRSQLGNVGASFTIEDNKFGVNGGGAIGVQLDRVKSARFSGNRWGQTTGNGTPIKLDSDCADIVIDRSEKFSTGEIDLNGCSRDEVKISPSHHKGSPNNRVTDFDGAAFSTSSQTIDMSVKYGQFAKFGGLAPQGYNFNLQARDSASAASTTTRVRISQSSGIVANSTAQLGLENVPNDIRRTLTGFVPCDDEGDIHIDIVASGAGTTDLWLTITEAIY